MLTETTSAGGSCEVERWLWRHGAGIRGWTVGELAESFLYLEQVLTGVEPRT